MWLLSDIWYSEGFIFEKQTNVFENVYYRHVKTKEGNLTGVIVDYELDDDFHYELTAENWHLFVEKVLNKSLPETRAFSLFLEKHGLNTTEGVFAFENTLNDLDIKYKKIAYY